MAGKGKRIDVVPGREGGWQVKSSGGSREFRIKRDAVACGRETARRTSGRLVIHRQDGVIQEERTYSRGAVRSDLRQGNRRSSGTGPSRHSTPAFVKSLTKVGNSHALVLDKPLMDLIGIDEGGLVNLTVSGGSLVVTPVHPRVDRDRLEEALERIDRKYGDMLNSLA